MCKYTRNIHRCNCITFEVLVPCSKSLRDCSPCLYNPNPRPFTALKDQNPKSTLPNPPANTQKPRLLLQNEKTRNEGVKEENLDDGKDKLAEEWKYKKQGEVKDNSKKAKRQNKLRKQMPPVVSGKIQERLALKVCGFCMEGWIEQEVDKGMVWDNDSGWVRNYIEGTYD